jgi:hypothetical protein
MKFVEKVECNCSKQRVGYAHFQGVHDEWFTSKLECSSNCLWDWRSYCEDGWQKREHVFSIGFSLLIDTQNNRLHLSSMINTKPFVMIFKKLHPWKKLTFNMLPFGHGGTHLELLARVLFKSSTIGSTSSTFMCDNWGGFILDYKISKLFHWNFIFICLAWRLSSW